MSRAEIDSHTYREAWDWHIKPAIEHNPAPASSNSQSFDRPSRGVADISKMNEAAANLAMDFICQGKKYEGDRWWEPYAEAWGWPK
jgi:hypothetical protein